MTRAPKVVVVLGTRPEAIKLFPVIAALEGETVETIVCVTGQHREMLDQVLRAADLVPDIDLNLMQPDQPLDVLTAGLLAQLGRVFDAQSPRRVVVQGDTSTAMAAALAAHYRKIPVAHVEAGLRSGNIYEPWPEEVNRKIISAIADLHFAPTETAAAALRAEAVDPATVHVTGNTAIDALRWMAKRNAADPKLAAALDPLMTRFAGKRTIAVTTHRRESFGDGMARIARAVARIAAREDVGVVFPVHPNPNVRPVMTAMLADAPNVAIVDPLDYPQFVRLLEASTLVLTDSGGVQEEAAALDKPVLVMRERTERPEGIAAGTAKLIGTDEDRIVREVSMLLDDEAAWRAMASAPNPFGDGRSAPRIARIIANALA